MKLKDITIKNVNKIAMENDILYLKLLWSFNEIDESALVKIYLDLLNTYFRELINLENERFENQDYNDDTNILNFLDEAQEIFKKERMSVTEILIGV